MCLRVVSRFLSPDVCERMVVQFQSLKVLHYFRSKHELWGLDGLDWGKGGVFLSMEESLLSGGSIFSLRFFWQLCGQF